MTIDLNAVGALTNIGLLLVAVVAAGFALRQLRRSTDELGVNARVAYASVTREAMTHLLAVENHVMDHPDMFPYFWGDEPPPAPGTALAARVQLQAELLIDTVECSLELCRSVPEFQPNYGDWREFARILWASPSIRQAAARSTGWANDFIEAACGREQLLPTSDRRCWLASGIMCRALAEDPLWRDWVSSRWAHQRFATRVVVWAYLRDVLKNGWIEISENKRGMIAWLGPGADSQSRWVRSVELSLGRIAFGRDFRETMRLFDHMSNQRKQLGRHLYAEFLGVEAEHRRDRIATNLASTGLAWAIASGLPVYLEAFTEENRAIYEAHGFSVIETLTLGRARGWGMLRPLVASAPQGASGLD